ncbi:nitroreductase/quinone reductase family protein [Microlunatus antarcticus]|uniref:Deazaflavin-dependent oxidoreductase (Nitroreductase family) n=1 Tax=Microlunatus antarcticus TaxID=53388 RepID=A0A7W5JXZ8_9ACTN|nr:deazaflavin-dependent oxidoreductase (nitroreductase family) [Microlunatus antarcticus]
MADWNQQIIEEFRANDGIVETMGFGRGLVLVHHLGARSGEERINPVANIREDDGSRLVAASAAGADKNPDWYHNLLAHPDVTVETPDGVEQVHVTDLHGAERDAAWARFKQMSDGFRAYEAKTDRVIPVLRLTPRG